ncbi:MAG: M48 family metallopeptidase [bacterium]|nr:M48 family metallopeptidase [bacterium]
MSDITYNLKYSTRARRVRIVISRGGVVTVVAPRRLDKNSIEKLVQEKKQWIEAKVLIFKNRPVLGTGGSRLEYLQYSARAKKLVMDKIKKINTHYGFEFERVTIKHLQTRWGSCSRQRNLNFNYRIVFLPDNLADYLVAHELCHLLEMNHSSRFWLLVSRAIPDYRVLAKELRGVI